MTPSCPICHKPVHWQNNRHRPFCSERCKLIDLGKWAEGGYYIPANETNDAAELPEPSKNNPE
ncbi:MAG: DNA gyrase inhibitor YacG [Nitrospiria bacterium]